MIGWKIAGLIPFIWAAGLVEPLERVGRLADPAIREASGIVASRRHPGIFWVHNDSSNPPSLYAVRRDGSLVRSYQVAAPNIDWEDIATDDAGHLYLADTGNNKLLLPVRVIHQVDEPDPTRAATATRPLAVLSSQYYRFAAGDRFDAEGLAIRDHQALLVAKRFDGQPAAVYRIRLDRPAPLLQPATPELVGTLPTCIEAVTGASLTADGRLLAVVTDHSVQVFEARPGQTWAPVGATKHDAPDVEAVTWDGPDLILASEDRSIYRVPERRWKGPQ